MKKKLLVLTAVLGVAAFASSLPDAEAIVYYCSDSYCADKAPEAPCHCPLKTDKAGNPSTCENWNSIANGGCWYE